MNDNVKSYVNVANSTSDQAIIKLDFSGEKSKKSCSKQIFQIKNLNSMKNI